MQRQANLWSKQSLLTHAKKSSCDNLMKLLFISLEFSASTFSGNGIYARSQVRALAQQGAEVLVLAGKPAHHNQKPILEGALGLIEVSSAPCQCLSALQARTDLLRCLPQHRSACQHGAHWMLDVPGKRLAVALQHLTFSSKWLSSSPSLSLAWTPPVWKRITQSFRRTSLLSSS